MRYAASGGLQLSLLAVGPSSSYVVLLPALALVGAGSGIFATPAVAMAGHAVAFHRRFKAGRARQGDGSVSGIGRTWRARIGTTAVLALAVAAVAGCGSEEPSTPGAEAPGPVAASTAGTGVSGGSGAGSGAGTDGSGTTAEIGSFADVVSARIPSPGAKATTAQLEMTLAAFSPGRSSALTAVSTPAAAKAELLSHGKPVSEIDLPISAGTSVQTGPPSPYEVELTGLREPLKLGESVKVTMTFGSAGQGTLTVPVTVAP
jgi:copper(I)-binding protein